MELLCWLLEGGDSEDREIQLSVFEISWGLFNLDAKDMEKSSAQVVEMFWMFLFIDYSIFPIKIPSCHSEEGYVLLDHQFYLKC